MKTRSHTEGNWLGLVLFFIAMLVVGLQLSIEPTAEYMSHMMIDMFFDWMVK